MGAADGWLELIWPSGVGLVRLTVLMMPRSQLVNSIVGFALACLVMVTVHEFGHVLAALAQGNAPVMYGFSVDDRSTTGRQQVVAASAGPLLSLMTGLGILAAPIGRLPGFWRLAVVWLGLLSVQEFSGYLITGPFAHVGDIGTVLEIAHAPAVLGWVGLLVGWAVTYLLGRHAVRRLTEFTSAGQPLGPQLRALGLFTWLLGALLVVVLSLGLFAAGGVGVDVVIFEAFGVLSSGIFLVFVRLFLRGAEPSQPRPAVMFSTPSAGVVALVAVALVRQFALAGGIAL
jgi:hypothetical protein